MMRGGGHAPAPLRSPHRRDRARIQEDGDGVDPQAGAPFPSAGGDLSCRERMREDMGLLRSVEPELLDQIPADDRRAIRARRDLKRLNAVILQTGIMVRTLAEHWGHDQPRTIL